MPHDRNSKELKIGDFVNLEARVVALTPNADYCNVTVEGVHGADDPKTKATWTGNSRAVEFASRPGGDEPAPEPSVSP
jgi:hypothetical protein